MRGLSGGHGTDRKDSGTGLTNSGQFHDVVVGGGGLRLGYIGLTGMACLD